MLANVASSQHCGFAALFIPNNLNRHYLCIQLAFSTQTPHVEHSNPNPRPNPHPNPSCQHPVHPPPLAHAAFTDSFGFVFAFHLYFNALAKYKQKRILILIRGCDIREHTHMRFTYICIYVFVWHIKGVNCSRFYARISFEFSYILQANWMCQDAEQIALKCNKWFSVLIIVFLHITLTLFTSFETV